MKNKNIPAAKNMFRSNIKNILVKVSAQTCPKVCLIRDESHQLLINFKSPASKKIIWFIVPKSRLTIKRRKHTNDY